MVEQIAAVREAVGKEIELCIDAHTRLDTETHECATLKPFRPFFIEDPLGRKTPSPTKHSRAHIAPKAAGDNGHPNGNSASRRRRTY
ncbi:MAG: hypothetical protein CM1200mP24_02430 [Gammaproteobacteria bacterium]|nr:MAG: hypothetical protein CM1200mP24_02430 [Gammaproteobacteria bacterium]